MKGLKRITTKAPEILVSMHLVMFVYSRYPIKSKIVSLVLLTDNKHTTSGGFMYCSASWSSWERRAYGYPLRWLISREGAGRSFY